MLLLVLATLMLWPAPGSPLAAPEASLYDLRLRLLAPRQADAQVVVIDIDERALAAFGRWPWPRRQLAQLLDDALGRDGARLLGLDLVLAEADPSSGLAALDRLAQSPLGQDAAFRSAMQAMRPTLDDDGQLAAVLRRRPVLLGFHLSNETGAALIGALPAPLLPSAMLGDNAAQLLHWAGHGGNLPQLQQAAALGGGHLNAIIDPDGRVRRVPLLVQHQQGVQPALALAMARAALGGAAAAGAGAGAAALSFEPADGPLRALWLRGPAGQLRLPVDQHAVALVPYLAPGVALARHSAADVLANRLPPGTLRGKLVLVGVSAPGLLDQRHTPVDEAMLGTLVHAQLLSGLLQGRLLVAPPLAPALTLLALAAIGALLVRSLPRLALWQGGLLVLVLALAWSALNLLAWWHWHWVLPLAAGLLLPPLLLALHMALGYHRATAARQHLTALFGQYVPPELVRQMSRAPERYNMASRSAELTVLFADVSGFSAVAERLPPTELGAMMNLLFSHLTDVVRAHHGTLDKYIGDSVMAFWGAPLDDPDHARHAVAAAQAMLARLPAIHADLAARGWPALQLHIGINTGTVVVGDMGSRHRRAYTVMGDAVNLAARLQGFSSRYGLGLVVGHATHAALGAAPCLTLGVLNLRGRDAGVPAWFPLPAAPSGPADPVAMQHAWQQLRRALRAGCHAEALAQLDSLQRQPGLAALCRWQRGLLRGDGQTEGQGAAG